MLLSVFIVVFGIALFNYIYSIGNFADSSVIILVVVLLAFYMLW